MNNLKKELSRKFITTSKITKILNINFNQGHHKLKPIEQYGKNLKILKIDCSGLRLNNAQDYLQIQCSNH